MEQNKPPIDNPEFLEGSFVDPPPAGEEVKFDEPLPMPTRVALSDLPSALRRPLQPSLAEEELPTEYFLD